MKKQKLKRLSLTHGTPAVEGLFTNAVKFLRGNKKKDPAPTNLAVSKSSFVSSVFLLKVNIYFFASSK